MNLEIFVFCLAWAGLGLAWAGWACSCQARSFARSNQISSGQIRSARDGKFRFDFRRVKIYAVHEPMRGLVFGVLPRHGWVGEGLGAGLWFLYSLLFTSYLGFLAQGDEEEGEEECWFSRERGKAGKTDNFSHEQERCGYVCGLWICGWIWMCLCLCLSSPT